MREFIREKVKTDKSKEIYEISKCPLLSLMPSPQLGLTFIKQVLLYEEKGAFLIEKSKGPRGVKEHIRKEKTKLA